MTTDSLCHHGPGSSPGSLCHTPYKTDTQSWSIIRPLESKIEDEEQDSLQRERNNSHFLRRKGKGIKL